MLFIVIALLVFITQYLLDYWWLIAVDAFLAAILVGKSGLSSFLSGFLAVGLVWFGMAFYLNYQNEGLLMGRIAEMFFNMMPIWILVITAFIGGLVGGFAALTGFSLKSLWMKNK